MFLNDIIKEYYLAQLHCDIILSAMATGSHDTMIIIFTIFYSTQSQWHNIMVLVMTLIFLSIETNLFLHFMTEF